MQMVVAAAALLLLSIVLSPIVARRFRLARRGRAVHLDGGCHWYTNYDEELRYEPHSRSDILRLPREDVLQRGYVPTDEVQNIPRTFRHRVPGDVKIRLWRSGSPNAKALWLCEWAVNPVRVAIGVGDRERVPGVESGCIPTAQTEQDAAPVRESVFESAGVVPSDEASSIGGGGELSSGGDSSPDRTAEAAAQSPRDRATEADFREHPRRGRGRR